MKGKYITTSLLLAIMATERSGQLDIAETKASVSGHRLIWGKGIPSTRQLRARLHGRDELKTV